ncbi:MULTISPECIES: hypothetical protein [Streptococcus]|uniref:Uncharacterized protein n=1 Tax=Streptococcus caledonicus TaxID=2614158 RepID=A0ABW0UEQ6_9STRE|nr:hypothetical protein [Streptococcus sp. S784/96/1]
MVVETFTNTELEIYGRIINHCPLESVKHMPKQPRFMYEQSTNADTHIRILNNLTITAKYFSELGYYAKADEIIKK